MYRFLNIISKKPSEQDLPDPNKFSDPKAIQNVNSAVANTMKEMVTSGKKRGNYGHYDDGFRTKVARCAMESGDTAAAKKFSVGLTKKLCASRVSENF